MEKIKLIGILLGGYLIYTGYNANLIEIPDGVDTSVEIEESDFSFPAEPTDEKSLLILNKLDSVMGDNYDDAFILANAMMQWADKVSNSPKVKNLYQLKNLYTEAVLVQFSKTPIEGKYKGKIDSVVDELYNHKLSYLKDSEGNVKSVDITPQIRASVVELFNELSWKFADIFFNSIPKGPK